MERIATALKPAKTVFPSRHRRAHSVQQRRRIVRLAVDKALLRVRSPHIQFTEVFKRIGLKDSDDKNKFGAICLHKHNLFGSGFTDEFTEWLPFRLV
jgi:hypothetical protein